MTASTIEAEPARVIHLAEYRRPNPAWPAYASDIAYCCQYARVLRTEHDAETARIDFECMQRGIEAWWEGPQDIVDRIKANNDGWCVYRALLKHIAALPAETRRQASMKRAAIGKMWLADDSDWSQQLRAGCEADDHLFPKSLKLRKELAHAN